VISRLLSYHGLYGSTSCEPIPMHSVKFDADIFVQSGVIDIFLFTYRVNPRSAAILAF